MSFDQKIVDEMVDTFFDILTESFPPKNHRLPIFESRKKSSIFQKKGRFTIEQEK